MDTKTIAGTEYVTTDALSGGDYGGCGYIARVNVQVLTEMAESFDHMKDHIIGSGFADFHLEADVEREIESHGTPPALIVCTGGHSSVTAYVRADCEELVEVVAALDDYPVVDDIALSEAEVAMESEAWIDYVAADCRGEIENLIDDDGEVDTVGAYIDDMSGDDFQALFILACGDANVYPEYESGGTVYYPGMPEVAKAMLASIRVDTDTTARGAVSRAARDGVLGNLFTEGAL